MLDNNNHINSNCAFAEQIVSYLYGEANAKEKTVFETHLNSCAACAEEFAGFSMARASVIEWRNEDFLTLQTPLIEISYEKPGDFYKAETNSKISRNWHAELHRVFSLSPALTASAAFAIVAICLGITFFANKFKNNIDVAGITDKNTEQKISTPIVTNEVFSNTAPTKSFEKSFGENFSGKQSKPLIANTENNNRKSSPNSTDTRKDLSVKISDVSRNTVRNLNRDANSSKIKSAGNENKKPLFAQTGKVPTLNNVEEDEDKSLRLAELFEDGDAR